MKLAEMKMAAAPRLRFCFGNAAAAADGPNHAHAGCGARASSSRWDGGEGRQDKTSHTMVPSSKPWDDSRSLNLTIRLFAWEARAAADHVSKSSYKLLVVVYNCIGA
ncbi:hypothetical protein CKAH01_02229 [Colletotrichum kahawae]|uniref:Uncharacterized protein n=1 Tax=Colletotrichum kahawae TaxID=34407 RepID=A0AAE0D048_COLKA|nr:hypothetical protein CKAH01_02229 [Colletotrichum kahawae]